MRAVLRAALAALFVALPLAAQAVDPAERLADPALEARARALSKELRCPVCQSQSIDDSNADLARDLRVVVRERLLAGDSDEAVLRYLRSRYGDYILMNPPFEASTLALWLAPPLLLLAGGAGIAVAVRRRRAAPAVDAAAAPLSAEEQRRLARLVGAEGEARDGRA